MSKNLNTKNFTFGDQRSLKGIDCDPPPERGVFCVSGDKDMNNGWIKLHRSILDHWIFQDADKLKWWIDLLLLANHSEKKVLISGVLFTVNRGETIRSLKQLAERWHVDRSKVRRFLTLLQNDNMIRTKNEQKTTRITICNYDDYQDVRNADETLMKRKRNADETQVNTNKNDKKEKNEKKEVYADFVSMLPEEYDKLVVAHGEALTKKFIETLNNYKGANGKKYKSDYLAILNWVVDRVKSEAPEIIKITTGSH